jgi:site-specific recombinase XerD
VVEVNIVTQSELARLLAVIPESSAFGARDRALLIFLQHTGLRVGELCGLNVGDLADPKRRAVHSKLVLRPEICKGGRSRTIPLCSKAQMAARDLLQFLERRGFSLDAEAPLLVRRAHDRLPVREVQRLVQGYRELAGISTVTPHSLRHHFAGRFLEVGGNVRQLQQCLGHRRLNTVEVYTRCAPDELAAVVARL